MSFSKTPSAGFRHATFQTSLLYTLYGTGMWLQIFVPKRAKEQQRGLALIRRDQPACLLLDGKSCDSLYRKIRFLHNKLRTKKKIIYLPALLL